MDKIVDLPTENGAAIRIHTVTGLLQDGSSSLFSWSKLFLISGEKVVGLGADGLREIRLKLLTYLRGEVNGFLVSEGDKFLAWLRRNIQEFPEDVARVENKKIVPIFTLGEPHCFAQGTLCSTSCGVTLIFVVGSKCDSVHVIRLTRNDINNWIMILENYEV